MADLKDFNKPDLQTKVNVDFLDTIKGNVKRIASMDTDNATNVPAGYRTLQSTDNDNIQIKEANSDGSNKTIFDSQDAVNNILETQITGLPKMGYPKITGSNLEIISKLGTTGIMLMDKSTSLRVIEPGWVDMTIVAPATPTFIPDYSGGLNHWKAGSKKFLSYFGKWKKFLDSFIYTVVAGDALPVNNNNIYVRGIGSSAPYMSRYHQYLRYYPARRGTPMVSYDWEGRKHSYIAGASAGGTKYSVDDEKLEYYIHQNYGLGALRGGYFSSHDQEFTNRINQYHGTGISPSTSDLDGRYSSYSRFGALASTRSQFYSSSDREIIPGASGAVLKVRLYLTKGDLRVGIQPKEDIYNYASGSMQNYTYEYEVEGWWSTTTKSHTIKLYTVDRDSYMSSGGGAVIIEPLLSDGKK